MSEMIAGFPVHPAALLWPPLSVDEFKELVADIKCFGLRQPIKRWQGAVIDGVHRLRACLEEGAGEPVFEDFEGNEDDVVRAIWSWNGVRRHLPARQRAALAVKMQDLIRLHQATVKRQANEARARSRSGTKLAPTEPIEKTKEFVGRMAGVSPATAQKAISVGKRQPELLDEVLAERMSLDEAYDRVREPADPASAAHQVDSKQMDLEEYLRGQSDEEVDAQLKSFFEQIGPGPDKGQAEAPTGLTFSRASKVTDPGTMFELQVEAPELLDEAMAGRISFEVAYERLREKRAQEAARTAAEEAQTRHTPDWVVRALLRSLPLPGGHWLDPCCGNIDLAEIAMTTDIAGSIDRWTFVDVREAAVERAGEILEIWPRPWRRKDRVQLLCHDWLAPFTAHYLSRRLEDVQVAIFNPPWWTPKGGWRSPRTGAGMRETSIALEFVETVWERCPQAHVVMLHALRLFDGTGCHGGMSRAAWLASHMPDEYRLRSRVAFTGPLGEDLPGDYPGPVVWFHWPPDGRSRTEGRVRVLSGG